MTNCNDLHANCVLLQAPHGYCENERCAACDIPDVRDAEQPILAAAVWAECGGVQLQCPSLR